MHSIQLEADVRVAPPNSTPSRRELNDTLSASLDEDGYFIEARVFRLYFSSYPDSFVS
jgi:hypothetical protein